MNPTHSVLRLLALMVPVVAATACLAPAAGQPRPNIVYINTDDLGWADLGCYGQEFHRTPAIDRLAREGLRFTCAYAASPSCTPSRVAFVTGQHPARLHMTGQASFYRDPPERKLLHPRTRLELPASAPSIGATLTRAGYRCVSFGKWGLGQHTLGHGFERVEDAKDAALTEMAVAFIEESRGGPFFLYLNYHWIHSPLNPDPAFAAASRKRVQAARVNRNPDYAAVVEQIDQAVERIVAVLEQTQLARNTLLVFTSDNGGFLGRDNETYTDNAPLREGKSSLYEGGIRVPLIVRWPGVVPAGATCDSPVGNLDWHPTFASLLGLSPPADTVFDGADIAPLLRGASEAPTRTMYWHFPHYRRAMATIEASPASAIRDGDWKLIHFYEDDHVEAYNLRDDPGERHDLAKSHPKRTAELRRKLDEWRTAVDAQPPVANPLYEFKGF